MLPAEQLRPDQASPEEGQKRDDMTPTKSVITNPCKGMFQVGSVVTPTVWGKNVIKLKVMNEAHVMRKNGVKPYTKDHFCEQYSTEILRHFTTDPNRH